MYLHQKMIRIYADIIQNHTLPGVFPNFWRAVYIYIYIYIKLVPPQCSRHGYGLGSHNTGTSRIFCSRSKLALSCSRAAASLSDRAGSVISTGISDPWEMRSSLRSSNRSSVLVLTTSGVPLWEWSVVWPSSPSETDRFSELKVDTDWHLVILVGRLQN